MCQQIFGLLPPPRSIVFLSDSCAKLAVNYYSFIYSGFFFFPRLMVWHDHISLLSNLKKSFSMWEAFCVLIN